MDKSEPDKVEVVYNAADLRALYRACRRCKAIALVVLIGLPVVFGLFSYHDGARGSDLVFVALPYIIIGLVGVLTVYVLGPWRAVRVRRKYGWGEPMSVSFTNDGVSTKHPNQASVFYWSKFRNVAIRGSRIFLFTTPACAIILPRRCFVDDEQFSTWAERARRLWQEASVTVE